MLRKSSMCQKAYSCFHCSAKGRAYSQGHASAKLSVNQAERQEISSSETSACNSSPERKEQLVETKTQLKIVLGETTRLLTSAQNKSDLERQRRLKKNGHIWELAVKAFDDRFNRGGAIRRARLHVPEQPTTISERSVHKKPNEKANIQQEITAGGFTVYSHDSLTKITSVEPEAMSSDTSPGFDYVYERKIGQFTKQMSAFIKVLLDESNKPDQVRESLVALLVNFDSQSKWFVHRKVLNTQLTNIVMKAYAEKCGMVDCIKFYQLIIASSAPVDTEMFIWMLLAALRSDNPHGNVDWVLDKMTVHHCTHRLKATLQQHHMQLHHDLMDEVKHGLTNIYPQMDLGSHQHSDTAYTKQYVNPVAASLNSPKRSINPHAGVISPHRVSAMVEKQITNEMAGDIQIESIVPVQLTDKTFQARERYHRMRQQWKEALAVNFQAVVEKTEFEGTSGIHIINWLKVFTTCMPADDFVSIMLSESERMCEMSLLYSPHYAYLCQKLGESVRKRYLSYRNRNLTSSLKEFGSQSMTGMCSKATTAALAILRPSLITDLLCEFCHSSNKELLVNYINKCYTSETHDTTYRKMFQVMDSDHLSDRCVLDQWPTSVIQVIGELLYDIILKSTIVPTDIVKSSDLDGTSGVGGKGLPAFYIVNRYNGISTIKQFKPHPSIVNMVETAQLNSIHLHVAEMPSFAPPIPSEDEAKGIFFQTQVNLVKTQQGGYFGESDTKEMLPVLDSLNVLAAVPWKVNTGITKLVTEVFNGGGDPSVKVPTSTENITLSDEDCEELSVGQLNFKLKKLQKESVSDRASFLLGLSVANYCGDDMFWLPSNLDFRGRAYPLSAHLSHVSSDPKRALLKFAKGKRLGKRGLEWLKIHLVNMSGHKKKASNAERLEYAEELLPLAFESADNPLEGEQWWKELDEPWQGLAACMELRAALSSGNPEEYISHLPIHQDGSCNGLQHYSALGGDSIGAIAVNVLPSTSPRDIYSEVAALVEKHRAKDAANGNVIAQLLEGEITRKVVKQTVMTTVYGVTRFGAQIQVQSHLASQAPQLTEKELKSCSSYIADVLFSSIANMFKSGTEIQDWLTLMAHLVTTVADKPVTWKTPLGLQVTQNYWSKSTVASRKQSKLNADYDVKNYGARHDTDLEKPDPTRHVNGFPPNFVHSLDATHMMLSALRCQREGITFASIHDCFWTHACDVDTMNKVCRQSFCDLYKEPILDNLSQYMLERYVDPTNPSHSRLQSVIKSVPQKGDLNIELVKQSEYFFS